MSAFAGTVMRKSVWRLLLLLVVMYFLSYLDRAVDRIATRTPPEISYNLPPGDRHASRP